jgi:solute carrier family 41
MTANSIDDTPIRSQGQSRASEDLSPYVQHDDDDMSVTSEDDGEVALLDSSRQSRRRDSSVRSRIDPDVWEQVKEIVLEVSGCLVFCALRSSFADASFDGRDGQTVPTLLLTTVGLLFTGELLDHVSVRAEAGGRMQSCILTVTSLTALESNASGGRAHHSHPCSAEPERKSGDEPLSSSRDSGTSSSPS